MKPILFRASYMGDLMTDGDGMITEIQLATIKEYEHKSSLTDKQRKELNKLIYKRDNPELSTTCLSRLIKVYAEHYYGRSEEVSNKYMEKGTTVEEDSITLYSMVKKQFFKKNDIRLSNTFFTGCPDIYDGETLSTSEEITDIKSSWSLITFLNAKHSKKINHDYKWQGNTYLVLLPKAKTFRLSYCLVNATAKLILDEKFSLQRKMGFFDPIMADEDPTYKEKCQQIERNHIFDLGLFLKHNPGFDLHTPLSDWSHDIPKEKRVHEFVWPRDNSAGEKMYARARQCKDLIESWGNGTI